MKLIGLLAVIIIFVLATTGCVSVQLQSPGAQTPGTAQGTSKASVTKSGQWHQSSRSDFEAGTRSKTKIADVGDGAVTLEDGAKEGTFTSSVKQTDFPFNAVGIVQNSSVPKDADVELEVRTSENGKDWSNWIPVHAKTLSKGEKDDGEFQIMAVKTGSFLQYRALLSASSQAPALEDITITYIDSSQGPNMQEAKNVTLPKAAGQPTIISREGWGANEKYRYDANGKEIWPEEYRKPVKLVIHHTLTQNGDDDPPATVRAVYYYHAVTLGWGDIGYNYLVDANGNIYEGRRGDGVVAGHAYGHNYGSIGIAVLGNYLTTDITDATRKSLTDLLAWLSTKYNIDPRGHSFFVDRDLPNIYGHRDSNQTSCPGTYLYDDLPNLRQATFDKLPAPTIKIDSPANGAAISSVQNIKFTQSDNWPISKVDYFVDDKPVATVNAPDWSWKLDSTKYSSGQHTLKMIVTNALGKQTTVTRNFTVSAPPVSTWYFAEGSTSQGFQTYLLLMNPTNATANVNVTLFDEAGNTYYKQVQVGPRSRSNVYVNSIAPNLAVGMKVDADQAIYAERAVYFGHDGHTSTGTTSLSKTWYFAEGSSGPNFDTWLLVLNPSSTPAKLNVIYYMPDGSTIVKPYTVGATSRLNINANKDVPNTAFAIRIDSDTPVVAERSMYFDGGRGGHNTMGATALSQTWYFAEGSTTSDFNTWILLLNPNATPAQVTANFMQDNGQTKTVTYTVPPTSRFNIWANTIVPNGAVATTIQSDQPIVAERSMYWSGGKAGHNTIGATAPAYQWFLPEGSTSGFNEWVLLLNPNNDTSNVTLTFLDDHGNTTTKSYQVPGNSRLNVWVNQIISSSAISTLVQSDHPIVAERSSYFADNSGGTNSMGIPK